MTKGQGIPYAIGSGWGGGRNTISRYELGHDILASALDSLEKVLVDQGVVFFERDRVYGTGVGVKERQSSKR